MVLLLLRFFIIHPHQGFEKKEPDPEMVSLCAFIFTTMGVIVTGDFHKMRVEAASFKHGQLSYWLVLLWSAISFQLGVLGGTAVLFLASTVMAGVLNAAPDKDVGTCGSVRSEGDLFLNGAQPCLLPEANGDQCVFGAAEFYPA